MPDTLVRPAHFWLPERTGSYGDEAIDLAELAGRTLDAEQRLVVDAMLSFGPGGKWLALESVIVEARQNGKTGGVLLPVVLFDLFLMPNPDRIVWTAHRFRTAKDAFNDFDRIIKATPELSRRVKRISYADGEEAIELHSGAKLEFLARSRGGGRGLGGKRLVMDEALFLSAEMMGALIPTLSARPDPQINYGSSAGLGTSDHLRNLRDRGRKGGDPSLVWAEWCAPGGWEDPPCAAGTKCTHVVGSDGCALDDELLWPLANPALGRRITYEYVRAERRALPPAEFGRERLGWFDLPDDDVKPIRVEDWVRLAIKPPDPPPPSPVFFIDCSPGLGSSSVAAGVRHRGKPHFELADHGPGADWVLERVVELKNTHPGTRFGILATGAVSALLPKLKKAGIEPQQFSAQDMGRACDHLQKLVAVGGLSHDGDALVSAALSVAVRRDVGDDLWCWSRRKSGDISPLVAVTGAGWLLESMMRASPLVAWR